jgi:hypothetical protein
MFWKMKGCVLLLRSLLQRLTMFFRLIGCLFLIAANSIASESLNTESLASVILDHKVKDFSNPFTRAFAVLQHDWVDYLARSYGDKDVDDAKKVGIEIFTQLPSEVKLIIVRHIMPELAVHPSCAHSENFDNLYKAASAFGRHQALHEYFKFFDKNYAHNNQAKIENFFYLLGDLRSSSSAAKILQSQPQKFQELITLGVKTDGVMQFFQDNVLNLNTPVLIQHKEDFLSPSFVMTLVAELMLKADSSFRLFSTLNCLQKLRGIAPAQGTWGSFLEKKQDPQYCTIRSQRFFAEDGREVNRSITMCRIIMQGSNALQDSLHQKGYIQAVPPITSALVQSISGQYQQQRKTSKVTASEERFADTLADGGTHLAIYEEKISILPPSIKLFTNLVKLEFTQAENYLKPVVIPDLAGLPLLKEIVFGNFPITQPLIDSIACAPNLETL